MFGATIVMTNRPVDDILESRAISIDMKPSTREFENPVERTDAIDLKAELAAFRFRHRSRELVKAKKPAKGRLGDILIPLYKIVLTFFPKKEERFKKLLEIIKMQKQDAATDTFEAQVVEAIINAEEQVVKGFLAIELIASLFNEGKKDKFTVRNSTIGRVVKGLGFTSRRMAGGKRGIFYDKELVEQVAAQYGLSKDVSERSKSVTSVTNATTDTKPRHEKENDTKSTEKPWTDI